MKISDVVRSKGDNVVTVKPDETVSSLLALLDKHRIGAVVVSVDGSSVDGIVSERDIVRHLHLKGTDILSAPVSSIMTSEVTTGSAGDEIADLAGTMTELRVRHAELVVEVVDECAGQSDISARGESREA